MKIALITDIHRGAQAEAGWDVRSVVAEFVDFAIDSKADLLVDLGDRIDDRDRAIDVAATAELASIFARFPGPRVHLLGNHDVVNLSAEDHAGLFGQPSGHRVVEIDGCRIVVWEPSVRLDRRLGFPAPTGTDLDWLVGTLEADDRPAVVVSHIPVSGAAMTGNFYFENNADLATYPNHADIRRAIARTGRAAIWISGHVHWNSVANVRNTFHLTLQSAAETFATAPDPAGAFGMLALDGPTARLSVLGRDPISVELPFRVPHPWPEPRPRVPRL